MVKKPQYVNEAGIKLAPIRVKFEKMTTGKYRWAITVLGNFENEVIATINSLNKKFKREYPVKRRKK